MDFYLHALDWKLGEIAGKSLVNRAPLLSVTMTV
jgi:hypothetical protein